MVNSKKPTKKYSTLEYEQKGAKEGGKREWRGEAGMPPTTPTLSFPPKAKKRATKSNKRNGVWEATKGGV